MSDHADFMEGFCEVTKLSLEEAEAVYRSWLEREDYSEIERIDLESGGYWTGLEIGAQCKEGQQ